MKRPVKFALSAACAVALLLVLALAALPKLLDPNACKDRISKAVSGKTGRSLTFQGDIHVTVFPWLGMSLDPFSLSNAPGFGDTPFLQVQKASVRVKLLPLLSRRIEAGKVVFSGLTLNLERKKDGTANWQGLSGAKKDPGAGDASSGGPGVEILAVEGIEIQDVSVNFKDGEKVTSMTLKDADLQVGQIEPGKPFDLLAGFTLVRTNPALEAKIGLSGKVLLDRAAQTLSVEGAKLTAEGAGEGLPLKTFSAALEGGVTASRATKDFAIPGMRLKLSGKGAKESFESLEANCSGDLSGNGKTGLIRLKGMNLSAKTSGGTLPAKDVTARGDVVLDRTAGRLDLAGLDLAALGMSLKGNIKADNIKTAPAFAGDIRVAPFNPRELLASLGKEAPGTGDPEALKSLSLDGAFTGAKTSLRFSRLALALDQTKAGGTLSVDNFKNPALGFDLQLDKLDLDRYLPPRAAGGEGGGEGSPGGAGGKRGLPVEKLRKLNMAGKVKIGELVARKIKSQDVEIEINGKNGVIEVRRANLKAYGGTFAAAGSLDARGDTPKFTLKNQVKSIAFGPLLMDLAGKDTLTGEGGLNLDLTGAGATGREIVKTLTGNASLSLANGTFKGISLVKLIRNAAAALRGQAAAGEGEDSTAFLGLTAALVFNNGVIQNNDLSLKSPLLNVQGSGILNLVDNKVDYLLKSTVTKGLEGAAPSVKGVSLANLTVPVRVSGDLLKPGYLVDPAALAQELVKNQGKSLADKFLKEKLGGGSSGEGPEAGIGGLLKGVPGGQQSGGAETRQTEGAGQEGQQTQQQPQDPVKTIKGIFGR
jgi:AsmA protein